MSRSNVKITGTADGKGVVEVDGVDLTRTVTSVQANLAAGELPTVAITLVAPKLEALDLTGASLEVSGVVMPHSVEMALHKYLSEKYTAGLIDKSTISDPMRSYSLDA